MIISVTIDPASFDAKWFETLGYRANAEHLLRGIEDNGLLVVDPNAKLLRDLGDAIQALPIKAGQQIQIRFAELQKRVGRRVIVADRSRCPCRYDASSTELLARVCRSESLDAVICSDDSLVGVGSEDLGGSEAISLGEYLESTLEEQRHWLQCKIPPIDTVDGSEFDSIVGRLFRRTRRLRVFDKQIGTGERLTRFHAGLSRLLTIWQECRRVDGCVCSFELYTCRKQTHTATEVVFARIRDNLICRLHNEFGIPCKLFFKEDNPSITHDRFLQTDSFSVSFSRGFDFVREAGALERCQLKLESQVDTHLKEYSMLPDALDPVEFV